MPPAERSSRDLLEARLRQASGTEPGRPVPASPVVEWGTGEEAVVRTLLFQNTSAGAARRRVPTESSAEIKAIATAAASTMKRRTSLIATGNNVCWRMTE